MFLGQRTTAGPRPSCRRSPNFGKVGKIMTHDWRPINHRGDILNNCNVGHCIHFVFYIASCKQLIKIRTQKPNLGLDISATVHNYCHFPCLITNKSQTHVNTMAEKCVLLHISKIIRRVCSSSHHPTVCRLLSIKADLTFISEAAANLQLRSRKGSEAGLTVRAPGSRTLTSGVDRPTLPAATRTRQPFSRGFNKLGSSGQIGTTLLDTAHYLTHGPSFVDTNNSALSPPFKGSHFLMAPCSLYCQTGTYISERRGWSPLQVIASAHIYLG